MLLTIGMPTFNDYDGVYFSIQALRMNQILEDVELLVFDNFGENQLETFCKTAGVSYYRDNSKNGSAFGKDQVFKYAKGEWVLCLDSHVLLFPGTVSRLLNWIKENKKCKDLVHGPLIYDDLQNISTHFTPTWHGMFWGQWATDPQGTNPNNPAFEVPAAGCGLMMCRQNAWLGFNPLARGWGGEECYIQQKYRQNGRRAICLPFLRWVHRFHKAHGIPYPIKLVDRVYNYLICYRELGMDETEVLEHFKPFMMGAEIEQAKKEADEIFPKKK